MISTGDALPVNPWHHGIMPKRSKPKRDFVEVARGIVERAIGEQMNGSRQGAYPESARREGRTK
jgi:hypothetical protein